MSPAEMGAAAFGLAALFVLLVVIRKWIQANRPADDPDDQSEADFEP